MYIKNGENKFICIDFSATTLDKSALLYLNQEPIFTEDVIELYDNSDFLMKSINRSDYKYETIVPFGDEFLVTLSNVEEEKPNIDAIKRDKIDELNTASHDNIVRGFDIILDNGEMKHFSLEVHDQQNINTICQYLIEHDDVETCLYHADGEDLIEYSRIDMNNIRDKMLKFITKNVEQYQILRKQVQEATTIEEVQAISFDIVID